MNFRPVFFYAQNELGRSDVMRKNELITKAIIRTQDRKLLEDIINQKISNLIKKDLSRGLNYAKISP